MSVRKCEILNSLCKTPHAFKILICNLNERKFKHGFGHIINPMWTEVETTEHFPWRCHFYSTQIS